MNRHSKLQLAILVAAAAVVAGFSPAFAAYPEKPVEFIVHNSPGAGNDLFTRAIVDILSREKIVTAPMVVMNKVGGSGAVAVSYVMQRKGDPYTLFTAATAPLTTMIKRRISLDEFTPLCRLVLDPKVLAVSGSSPYKNISDLITAAKATRKGVKMAFGSVGGSDHMIGSMIQKATGAEFNMISFKSGNEAVTAVLGGHADFTTGNPVEIAGLVDAGKLRMLGMLSEQRSPFFPNLPTLREKGVDVVFAELRGMFLTKDVSPEIFKYWETAFDKLRKTDKWKELVKNDNVIDAPLNGAAFKSWLAKEVVLYERTLKDLGQLDK